jgi:hypothetical protein
VITIVAGAGLNIALMGGGSIAMAAPLALIACAEALRIPLSAMATRLRLSGRLLAAVALLAIAVGSAEGLAVASRRSYRTAWLRSCMQPATLNGRSRSSTRPPATARSRRSHFCRKTRAEYSNSLAHAGRVGRVERPHHVLMPEAGLRADRDMQGEGRDRAGRRAGIKAGHRPRRQRVHADASIACPQAAIDGVARQFAGIEADARGVLSRRLATI